MHCYVRGMPPYRNLKAWKHAQRLAVECANAARDFPAHEQSGLAQRLRQAAYSVPLAIAQGVTRRGTNECRAHLDAARGSLAEVSTILELAKDLAFIEMVRFARLEALADEANKTLYGLVRKHGAVQTQRGG